MSNGSDKKTPMTPDAARRIQRDADRTDTNTEFKKRAQRAADKNRGSSSGGKKK